MLARYVVRTDKSAAQLFIRLALGGVMFPHGVQKVFGLFGGPGFHQTLSQFAEMGYAAGPVMILMFIELVGSVLLVFGLLTRLWALGIGTTITICMFQFHVEHGFFMNWFGQQQGEGIEYHLLVIGIALALVVRGGGRFSVDRVIDKRMGQPKRR
jgi:putative oxidoreductase